MGSFKEGEKDFIEHMIQLNRVSKAVKGGRNMSFSALVVTGDGNGSVGYGFGKANDVTEAIRKASSKAKKSMIKIIRSKNTIPHQVTGRYKSSSILIKPAAPGTGVIAGGAARAVFEAAGIKDILCKSQGSRNKINTVKGVFEGLSSLYDVKSIAEARGKSVQEIWG